MNNTLFILFQDWEAIFSNKDLNDIQFPENEAQEIIILTDIEEVDSVS